MRIPGPGGRVGAVSGHSHGRSFNGTNQALQSSTTIDLSATKVVTIWFWLNQTSFSGNNDPLVGESSSNFNSNSGAFLLDASITGGSSNFGMNANAGGGNILSCHFNDPSAGAWHSFMIIWDISVNPNTCVAYVDGTSVTITYGNQTTGTTTNFGNYTVNLMSRNQASLWDAGSLAEFAIWKGNESANISVLNAGTSLPSAVDASNLISYVHICGTASPEPDSKGSWNWTLTGTPAQVTGPGVLNCP